MKTFEEAIKSFSATHNPDVISKVSKYDGIRKEIINSEWTQEVVLQLIPYVLTAGLTGTLKMAIGMGVELGMEMEKPDFPEVTV